jgi:hypothetical protein
MSKIELWPEQPTIQADQIEASFMLEDAQGTRTRCWYKVSCEQQSALTESCDPYILPAIFIAMQKHARLVVHGQVSPSLMKNLTELQTVWAAWRPGIYTPVEISADLEQECQLPANRAVLAPFSGGVDSVFTVWRHHYGLAGRQNLNIQAGLMMHGFDIRLNQPEAFARAAQKAQKSLDGLGIKLITIATNLKKIDLSFEDAQSAILASCMMLLQGAYSTGVIASSYPYNHLHLPWGSNPITDQLLSSTSFNIVHDATAFTRLDKVKWLAQWPDAVQSLRVCLEGENRDENCCRCEKCVRTILEFRVLGLGLPTCFKNDVSNSQVARLDFTPPGRIHFYNSILAAAKAKHISAPWVSALKWAYFYNRLLLTIVPPLKRIPWLSPKIRKKRRAR